MKRKNIFVGVIFLLVILVVIGVIVWNSRIVSIISLDINPSIEINLNRNNNILKVISVNDDGKNIISNDLRGKRLEKGIEILVNNLINKEYIMDKDVSVILYTSGDIENRRVENLIRDIFNNKEIHSDIIVIDNVTNEDREFAKKNNISLGKASYINSVLKDKDIDTKYLVNKSVRDLVEAKRTGKYCEDGYFIEGDFCLKEIERKNASSGMVCPSGYYEYNNKCYEEVPVEEKDNYVCREEFSLNGKNCSRIVSIEAEASKYSCSSGEKKTRLEMGLTNADAGDANDIVCVDISSATHPVSPCELPADDSTERLSYGGKCYWHRAPVIAEGCPGKIQVAGECWDDASSIYICAGYRDGKQYKSKSEYCEHSIKYIEPVVSEYKCPEGFILNGSKCEKEEIEEAMHERFCPNKYSLVNNDRCINYDKSVNKVDGYVCNQEHSRLRGNMCIIYDERETLYN